MKQIKQLQHKKGVPTWIELCSVKKFKRNALRSFRLTKCVEKAIRQLEKIQQMAEMLGMSE